VSAGPLFTVTLTVALVVEFPAASFAIALSVCAPLVAVVVFHDAEYGVAVSKPPRLAPSSWNCTLATPTLSAAVAVTAMVEETVAPFAGAVSETVGGVVSGVVLLTVTVTTALVAVFPAPSLAMAFKVCAPFVDLVVSQEKLYGATTSRVPTLTLSSWNCTLATLTLSVAFADTVTVADTVAVFAGAVSETVGGVVSGVVLSTFTVSAALVVELPAPSVAVAVRTWLPLERGIVFREYAYGALASADPVFAPSTLNCTLATATLSVAVAVTFTIPDKVALAIGELIATVGAIVSPTVEAVISPLVTELPVASVDRTRRLYIVPAFRPASATWWEVTIEEFAGALVP